MVVHGDGGGQTDQGKLEAKMATDQTLNFPGPK